MDSIEKQPKNDLTRRGNKIYRSNPSLVDSFPKQIKAQTSKKLKNAFMIAPGTGEVVAEGAFAFVEEREMDSEQFVKVYLEGIKQFGQLSKAGVILFEYVYRKLSGINGKDKDTVDINFQLVLDWNDGIARSTFFKGMKELIDKEFLFRSLATDIYFVNIRFMFNGNRMVLIKSFQRNMPSQKQKTIENPVSNSPNPP